MESVTIENAEVVWTVSCGFTAAGEASDYQIEEISLSDKPPKVIELLATKLNNGVFLSPEIAERWIAATITKTQGGCCCSQDKTAPR